MACFSLVPDLWKALAATAIVTALAFMALIGSDE